MHRGWTAGGITVFVAGVLLHLPVIASRLGGCPFGFDRALTDGEKEAGRRAFAASHAGTAEAASRPALGFDLDETTRDDVLRWASAAQVPCTAPKAGADLECAHIPEASLPPAYRGAAIERLWMRFGAQGELTSLVAVRRDPSAGVISAAFDAVRQGLDREAGPACTSDPGGAFVRLVQGPLHQAIAEYRFKDYYALARATNMGADFVLTEEYRSLPN